MTGTRRVLRSALRDLGYVKGKNIVTETRRAEAKSLGIAIPQAVQLRVRLI